MDWNESIREVMDGHWRDPGTDKAVKIPPAIIRIEESLDGGAADLVAPLRIGKRIAVVSDVNTHEAMGRRVVKDLRALGAVDDLVFPGNTHCDEETIAAMQDRTRHADAIVAVGSGSLCDTAKYATFKDGRRYVAFATAASMNGYAAATASVTLGNGYKTSLPAHGPAGLFIDLKVNADAPIWLPASGLGDSLCRPTAQVEWWGAHRLLGTPYSATPFHLLAVQEKNVMASAADLAKHSVEANGHLYQLLIHTGFGNVVVGTSHPGSMGEHQVSHWIDMFAGKDHPGSTHGQQVGVAALALARLHKMLFALDRPPQIKPKRLVVEDFILRYGSDIGRLCHDEALKKSFDQKAADAFNARLRTIWDELRTESVKMMIAPEDMAKTLSVAEGPTTATELGLSREVWRKAMKHARDVRNRWSYLDLADDAGLLDGFLMDDVQ